VNSDWSVKNKNIRGSVSAEGANAYAILLWIYVTCKLQDIFFNYYKNRKTIVTEIIFRSSY